jgi:hypothetical protein
MLSSLKTKPCRDGSQENRQRSRSPLPKTPRVVNNLYNSGLGLAKQAFEDAVKEFSTEVSAEECAKWLSASNTIFDVEQAVISAKQKYENRSPKSRARKWLSSCSSRLMYYSVIMDTLSQHHPEYVSLAWGAIKFLFIVSKKTS